MKEKSKMKIKFKGQLKTYLVWPIFMTLLLLAVTIGIAVIDYKAGILAAIATIIYFFVCMLLYFYNRPKLMKELLDFASDYSSIQKKLLKELSIPYALIDSEGKFLWINADFDFLLKKDNVKHKFLKQVFESLPEEYLDIEDEKKDYEVEFNDGYYRLEIKKIPVGDTFATSNLISIGDGEELLYAIYLFDQTKIKMLQKQNFEQKMVAGLIYIDNYEEALESVEDVRRSLLVALIDRKINKYIAGMNGIVKKVEKDKYFIAFTQRHLEVLQAGKFSIIDDVKTVNIGNEIGLTISIGLGVNGDNYIQNCDYSRVAIDLALGRGGDQAVVKDREKIYYYGGKSKQVEKNTRVKARVKAHALREILENKDKVIIMGHQIGDVDSFGASVGIYRATKAINKKAHIVINEVTTSVRPMMDRLLGCSEYDSEIFIKSSEAVQLVDANTTVIVVDVNRPSYTECPELLEICKSIVVLDHHRQSTEVIDNAVLSYIEPYASSTCEMVSEILQYISDGIKLKPTEADAVYAGIVIDTNNFIQQTGVRTFEAAAFLRRNGADITKVRMMLRDDFEDYKVKATAIKNVEMFSENFAITVCPSDNIVSPTVVGAKIANELLNINGILASFVVTNYNNKMYISARSIDEFSVQLIMERLGGGGHHNVAGAQLENISVEDACELVKGTVKDMLDKGEI